MSEQKSVSKPNIVDINVAKNARRVNEAPLVDIDSKEYTTVGALLKSVREARAVSYKDVSAKTKIKISQITAIENMDLAALPVAAYTLGFIRTYAEFLELPADRVLLRFRYEADIHQSVIAPEIDTQGTDLEADMGRHFSIMAVVALIAFFLWVAFQVTRPPNDGTVLTPVGLPLKETRPEIDQLRPAVEARQPAAPRETAPVTGLVTETTVIPGAASATSPIAEPATGPVGGGIADQPNGSEVAAPVTEAAQANSPIVGQTPPEATVISETLAVSDSPASGEIRFDAVENDGLRVLEPSIDPTTTEAVRGAVGEPVVDATGGSIAVESVRDPSPLGSTIPGGSTPDTQLDDTPIGDNTPGLEPVLDDVPTVASPPPASQPAQTPTSDVIPVPTGQSLPQSTPPAQRPPQEENAVQSPADALNSQQILEDTPAEQASPAP